MKDASKGENLNETELAKGLARHAYNWTTQVTKIPRVDGKANVINVSRRLLRKYSASYLVECASLGASASY